MYQEQKMTLGNSIRNCMLGVGSLVLLCSLTSVMGCRRCTTLEEQKMAYETMVETSPRNMNEQPKAIQEFKFTFGGPPKTPDCRDIELEQASDRDIFIEKN